MLLRRRLAWMATATVLGIVVATSVDATLGGVITVAAYAALVASLHRFGRTGPG